MIHYYTRVRTKEQLEAVMNWGQAEAIMLDGELASMIPQALSAITKEGSAPRVILCLPDIARQSRLLLIETMVRDFTEHIADQPLSGGILLRNLDELGLAVQMDFGGLMVADSFLYAYNSEAVRFYRALFPDMLFISSDELTDREQDQTGIAKDRMIIKIYGYQPLMISNQCLNKNYTACRKHKTTFTDSHRERFHVISNCRQCYSVIYNGKCTWLGDKVNETGYNGCPNLLFDFTIESSAEIVSLLRQGSIQGCPGSFTRGHHFKGVE